MVTEAGSPVGVTTGAALRYRISGTGLYVPPQVQTAAEVAELVGRSEDWVHTRTGVAQRHVSTHESMAQMGAEAARPLLDDGPPDLILNASLTPIQLIPDSSVFVQQMLGLSGIPSFSIHATCLSFLTALNTAGAYVQAGLYRRILVVSSEQGSICRDLSEPESAALIGDGAAAVLVEPAHDGTDTGLLGFAMGTWPEGAAYTELRGCGTRRHPNHPDTRPEDHLFHMNGPRVYRMAFTQADSVLDAAFAQAGLTRDDVDVVIPHQASGPMLAAIPRFGFPAERVVNVIGEYGNCIAASLPMTLARAVSDGRLQRGDTALMFGTGAGLSMAAALIRF